MNTNKSSSVLIGDVPFDSSDKVTLQLRSVPEIVLATGFLLLIMLTSIIGNIAVIAIIRMQKSLRLEKSNLLIVNLCITDLSKVILVMTGAFISLCCDEWSFGDTLCDIVCGVNYCLFIVSMLTLCFISLVRYQAVMHPLLYEVKVKQKHIILVIIYSWIQGIAFGLAPSVSGWVAFDYWENACEIEWHLHRPDTIIYIVVAFVLCYLIPGFVLLYCYSNILKEAKQLTQKVSINSTGDSNKQIVSDQVKLTWSLISIILCYLICTTPFCVCKLIKVIAIDEYCIPGQIDLTASMLAYAASAINPLIYGVFRRDFRTAYTLLLRSAFYGEKYPQCILVSYNSAEVSEGIDDMDM